MKNIIKKIKKLKTDNIYTNYLICYNDISHIISRCNYDTYLIKFINKCCKFNIKLYYLSNENVYYFLNKNDIIIQINNLKKIYILQHINILNNFINNETIDNNQYINLNMNIINSSKKYLITLDKFINLTNIVYLYKLLEINTNIENTIFSYDDEYNNLINNSINLSKYADNGVILIDQYSS
jgi:hypothetical protein